MNNTLLIPINKVKYIVSLLVSNVHTPLLQYRCNTIDQHKQYNNIYPHRLLTSKLLTESPIISLPFLNY